MDEHGLTADRDAATAYAREHARELATELLEWSDTTLLRDGRVRELARMLQVLDAAHALTLARSFAEHAALELAARRTTPDREAWISASERIPLPGTSEVLAWNSEGWCAVVNPEYVSPAFPKYTHWMPLPAAPGQTPVASPRDTLIEEIAEMVDHMGEGRRLEEYVGAIREMKSGDKGGA